jgi:hypothetical protein
MARSLLGGVRAADRPRTIPLAKAFTPQLKGLGFLEVETVSLMSPSYFTYVSGEPLDATPAEFSSG